MSTTLLRAPRIFRTFYGPVQLQGINNYVGGLECEKVKQNQLDLKIEERKGYLSWFQNDRPEKLELFHFLFKLTETRPFQLSSNNQASAKKYTVAFSENFAKNYCAFMLALYVFLVVNSLSDHGQALGTSSDLLVYIQFSSIQIG